MSRRKAVLICINIPSVSGGAETFSIRVANWLNKNSLDSYWLGFYKKNQKIDQDFVNEMSRLIEHKANVLIEEKKTLFDYLNAIPFSFSETDELTIISLQSREMFFIGEYLKKKWTKVRIRNLFYVVHPHDFEVFPKNKLEKIFKIFLDPLYRWLKISIAKNNALIFMDEATKAYALKGTNCIELSDSSIIRLPYPIEKHNENMIKDRFENSAKIILTCSRIDFPQKEYLLGLVSQFRLLREKFANIRLVIVGDGKDTASLREHIDSMPIDVKKNIELVGAASYPSLRKYIQQAYIYVGMGTTLLDASNLGVPAILTAAYQKYPECNSPGYFYQRWNELGNAPASETDKTASFYIEEILEMSYSEYKKNSMEAKKALEENYNIDVIMGKFLAHETVSTNLLFSEKQWYKYKFVEKIKSKMKRMSKKSFFTYRKGHVDGSFSE